MSTRLPDIPDLDDDTLRTLTATRLHAHGAGIDALGRVGALAQHLCLIQGCGDPSFNQPHLLVFAADHGIAARGVSAQPAEATLQALKRMLAGTARINALCAAAGVTLRVIDCGVRGASQLDERWPDDERRDEPPPSQALRSARVSGAGDGTDDASRQIAMAPATRNVAIDNGMRIVRETPGNAILVADLGAGSSSSAALMMALLTGQPLEQCVGRGLGLDSAGMSRKVTMLRMALQKHARAVEPLAALASVGGLETATQVGAILQAAHERRAIVIDGFGATAAVAVAQRIAPHVLQRCIFAHRVADSGHARWLDQLGVEPLLDLGIRTGDGVGALLAWNIVASAAAMAAGAANAANVEDVTNVTNVGPQH